MIGPTGARRKAQIVPWRKILLLSLIMALAVIGVATYLGEDAGNGWPPSHCSGEQLSREEVWECW